MSVRFLLHDMKGMLSACLFKRLQNMHNNRLTNSVALLNSVNGEEEPRNTYMLTLTSKARLLLNNATPMCKHEQWLLHDLKLCVNNLHVLQLLQLKHLCFIYLILNTLKPSLRKMKTKAEVQFDLL